MKPSELARALESLLAEFERLNVRYAIGGSVASSFYGMPRAKETVIKIDVFVQGAIRMIGRPWRDADTSDSTSPVRRSGCSRPRTSSCAS